MYYMFISHFLSFPFSVGLGAGKSDSSVQIMNCLRYKSQVKVKAGRRTWETTLSITASLTEL